MKMTIVIPTRNRADTLRYTLLTCLAQKYRDMEIIVSDNCSDDDTEAMVRSLGDQRIRYIRTLGRISMRANFEYALSHVADGFVGFVGDDDGLLPDAIERAATFIARNNVSALTSVLAFYRWPSAPDTIKNTGSLQLCPGGDTIRDSALFVNRALKGTGAFYIHDLPSLYYGFADIKLTRAKEGGQFFNSITPDAYSAFAIAAQVCSYGYLGTPLFIVGASGRSNGVSSFIKDANKQEAVRFLAENDMLFHEDFKLCNSVAVYVHEAFRQAARLYPKLVQLNEAVPLDLIRYMAREQNEYNRSELLDSAMYTGERAGLSKSTVDRTFSFGNMLLSRVMFSARKRLAQILEPSVLARRYPDMQAHGVSNVYEAALFMRKELTP